MGLWLGCFYPGNKKGTGSNEIPQIPSWTSFWFYYWSNVVVLAEKHIC